MIDIAYSDRTLAIDKQDRILTMRKDVCTVCNNFEKRIVGPHCVQQRRIAFDFAPSDVQNSTQKCPFCEIVVKAVEEFVPSAWNAETPVTRTYVRGPAEQRPHTLSLEIYFASRPKLELEVYSLEEPSKFRATRCAFRPNCY